MSGNSRRGAVRSPATGRRPVAQSRPGAQTRAEAAADAERVAALLDPVVSAAGMDLEGVRITAAGRRRLLRVLVDADGGVGLDRIALISRELSERLDETALMGERPYTLEVSSPGVDRPLTERRHWRRAIGRLVIAPLPARSGPPRYPAPGGGRITLDIGGQSREFRYGDLGPGKIQIEFTHLTDDADDSGGDDDEGADEEGSDGY